MTSFSVPCRISSDNLAKEQGCMVYRQVLDGVCCSACVFYFSQVSQPRVTSVFTVLVNGMQKKKKIKCRKL